MSKSNETIYERDFEASKVKEIYANYYGDSYSFIFNRISIKRKAWRIKEKSKVQ
jgi:hypothetical protein